MKRQFNAYIKYSTMGFQMIASILICAWLGNYLDEYLNTNKAYFTLLLMLLGVLTSIILLIRGIKKINDEKKDTNQK
ncbi:MAG: AtpZ/AtpI family protein [Flammeovirgaceae bacterium]